jgi:hypothetical protein
MGQRTPGEREGRDKGEAEYKKKNKSHENTGLDE